MRKTIFWLVIIGILLFTSLGYCANYNVQSNTPQNNQGYIFISTGQKQGGTEIGTWTDPITIPTLKGDKGDQGIQGIAGKDGYTPIKNIDYFDGVNGADGLNGKDVDPATVTNLQNEDNILDKKIIDIGDFNSYVNNRQDNQLQDHENRINALEETQYNVESAVRILDTKKTTLEIYNTYDIRHSREIAIGIRVIYKLGKSYQDRVNEKIETRLSNLEKTLDNSPIITKVVDIKGNTKSVRITENGLKIEGGF